MRLTGLRETIISASDPATMMQRVLAGALVLVPSADGAVIGLCTNADSLVFAAASGRLVDSVGSVAVSRRQPLGTCDQDRRHSALPLRPQ